jgi:DNA-binding CsgD family transcriptional regulator
LVTSGDARSISASTAACAANRGVGRGDTRVRYGAGSPTASWRTAMRLASSAPIVSSQPRSTRDDDLTRPNESISVLMASLAASYGLSERERAITRLVFLGFEPRTIAERLSLSERMVDWQLQDVFAKTGTDTAKALIQLALQHAREAEAGDVPARAMPRWSNITHSE